MVLARYATNRRLGAALHQQAFLRTHCVTGRAGLLRLAARPEDWSSRWLRQLANRLVGILHGRLKTGTKYDERTLATPDRHRCLTQSGHGTEPAVRSSAGSQDDGTVSCAWLPGGARPDRRRVRRPPGSGR